MMMRSVWKLSASARVRCGGLWRCRLALVLPLLAILVMSGGAVRATSILVQLKPEDVKARYHSWADEIAEADGIFLDWASRQQTGEADELLELARRWQDDNPDKPSAVQIRHIKADEPDAAGLRSDALASYLGTRLVNQLFQTRSDDELRVEDSSRFRLEQYEFFEASDRLLVMAADADGRPDPSAAELMELIGIDEESDKLVVQRFHEQERRSHWQAGSWVLPLVQLHGRDDHGVLIYHPASEAGLELAVNEHLDMLRSEDGKLHWKQIVLKHVRDLEAIDFMLRATGRDTVWNGDGEADSPEQRRQSILDFSTRLIQRLQQASTRDLALLADVGSEPTRSFELIRPDGLCFDRVPMLVGTGYANLSSWLNALEAVSGGPASNLIEVHDSWSLGLALITGGQALMNNWPSRRNHAAVFGPDGDERGWMGAPLSVAGWVPMPAQAGEQAVSSPSQAPQWIQSLADSQVDQTTAALRPYAEHDAQSAQALLAGLDAGNGGAGLAMTSEGGSGTLWLSIRPANRPVGDTPYQAGMLTESGVEAVPPSDFRYPLDYSLLTPELRKQSTDAHECVELQWWRNWDSTGTFADYLIRVPARQSDLHFELEGFRGDALVAIMASGDGVEFDELATLNATKGKTPGKVDMRDYAGEPVLLRIEARKAAASSGRFRVRLHGLHFTESGGKPAYRWKGAQRLTRRLTFLKWDAIQTFEAYVRWNASEPLAMTLRWQGDGQLAVGAVRSFACSGVLAREFEEALVLLNGSDQERAIDLEKFTPGDDWAWLEGDESGHKVREPVTINPLESLILVRD